jgi:hypothetical protein
MNILFTPVTFVAGVHVRLITRSTSLCCGITQEVREDEEPPYFQKRATTTVVESSTSSSFIVNCKIKV